MIKVKNYYLLEKFGYIHGKDIIEEEYIKRYENYGSIHTNLDMITHHKHHDGSSNYELFMIMIPEIYTLLNVIRKQSEEIKQLMNHLPNIANRKLFQMFLVDEIKQTNDIESIVTTRKQIRQAIENVNTQKNEIKLLSFVRQYLNIIENSALQIKTLNDIRSAYDFLLNKEIDDDNQPDGVLFRNGSVRIGTANMTVHQPKQTEAEIITQLEHWLTFNQREDVDSIVKVMISHLYFEYIHPFYDGNGRLGRYILAVDIAKILDPYTAVSLSHPINKNKQKYYKVFKNVENSANRGEVTEFVIFMLTQLKEGQAHTLDKLKTCVMKLQRMEDYLKNLDETPLAKKILYPMMQSYIFDDLPSIEDRQLIEYIQTTYLDEKISKSKIQKTIQHLTDTQKLSLVKKRPKTHCLSQNYLEDLSLI